MRSLSKAFKTTLLAVALFVGHGAGGLVGQVPADAFAGGAPRAARDLADIGVARGPLYVYPVDLDFKTKRFLRDATIQRRVGDKTPVKLDPKQPNGYLWVIDAQGALLISPNNFDANGFGLTNHVRMTAGGMALLAGELRADVDVTGKVTWIVNNDSGRYGIEPSVTEAQLGAARDHLAQFAFDDGTGAPAFATKFFPAPAAGTRAAIIMQKRRGLGGYLLVPNRGQPESIPLKYRSTPARYKFAKQLKAKAGR